MKESINEAKERIAECINKLNLEGKDNWFRDSVEVTDKFYGNKDYSNLIKTIKGGFVYLANNQDKLIHNSEVTQVLKNLVNLINEAKKMLNKAKGNEPHKSLLKVLGENVEQITNRIIYAEK